MRKGTKVKIVISMEIQVNQIGEGHYEREKLTCVSHTRQSDKRRQRMWITEGFRKGDKVGIGQGQRSDLRDGGELLRRSGGKDRDG